MESQISHGELTLWLSEAPTGKRRAERATYMEWEYRLADFPVPESRDEMKQVDATLNEFGSLGWEVVSASIEGDGAIFVIFKRPR